MQPNRGPGVHASARWRIERNPSDVSRPTRAPRFSSTALVATVVPCRIVSRRSAETPAFAPMTRIPSSTPTGLIVWSAAAIFASQTLAGVGVVQQEVGERSAYVDPEPQHGGSVWTR